MAETARDFIPAVNAGRILFAKQKQALHYFICVRDNTDMAADYHTLKETCEFFSNDFITPNHTERAITSVTDTIYFPAFCRAVEIDCIFAVVSEIQWYAIGLPVTIDE